MTDPIGGQSRRPADVPAYDHARAEAAVRELLSPMGEDPEREGLRDTPARVARAYAELTAGLRMTPEDVLTTTFDIGHDEMVLVRDIELWSMCEHHLVPFTGVAHVGYIPAESGKITGLSKLARLVDVYAKRPQVQERLTTQVADAMMEILEARGVIVVIEAEHLCMTMRGVRKAGARTITSAVRGIMHNRATRAEAMAAHPPRAAECRPDRVLARRRPRARCVMGVVNVTPDSFSDGGRWLDARRGGGARPAAAGARVRTSSTWAGSPPGPAPPRPPGRRGAARVLPVIRALAADGRRGLASTPCGPRWRRRRWRPAPRWSTTSRAASPTRGCSRSSPASDAPYVAMHWRAHSDRMADFATYDEAGGVVEAVCRELAERVEAMLAAGIAARADRAGPGARVRQDGRATTGSCCAASTGSMALGFPLLVGASPQVLPRPPARRRRTATPRPTDGASMPTPRWSRCWPARGVWGIRVHDVRATRDALAVVRAASRENSMSRPRASTVTPGVECFGHHGVFDFERREGQTSWSTWHWAWTPGRRRRRTTCATPWTTGVSWSR